MRAAALPLCVCGLLTGCTLDSLWGSDSPRPALHKDDRFDVDPLCRDLVVDSNSLAPVPVVVTLTGKRRNSNLGAESVPVSVTRGFCHPEGNHDVSKTSDAGKTTGAGNSSADAGTSSGSTHHCERPAVPLKEDLFASFELVEDASDGCRQRSPARLDCTLNPRGEAAFGVIAHLSEEDALEGTYVPICIRPFEFPEDAGPAEPHHEYEVWVLPRPGVVSVALATIAIATPEPNVTSDAGAADIGCDELFDCEASRTRVALVAGFASAEIPAGSLQRADLQPARRTTSLRASLSVVADPAQTHAFLSDTDCDMASTTKELTLTVDTGDKETPVFYVCGGGHAASYRVVTRFAGEQADAGEATGSDKDAGTDSTQDPSLVLRPADIKVESEPSGFVVIGSGGQRAIETRQCDGASGPTPASGLIDVSPPLQADNNGNVVLDCSDDSDGGGAMCPASPIRIAIKDGQACGLEVTNP